MPSIGQNLLPCTVMVTTPNEWTIFEWDETPKTNKSKWYLINWARKEGAKRCRIFKITFSRSSREEEIWESWRRGTGPAWDRTVSGRRLYWWRGRSECSPVERHIPEINNITTYMYIIRLRETEIQIAKKIRLIVSLTNARYQFESPGSFGYMTVNS